MVDCFEMRDLPQELKSDHPNYPNHPSTPETVQKTNFYNFHPMSMKFCIKVTFGGIQLIVDQGQYMVSSIFMSRTELKIPSWTKKKGTADHILTLIDY